MSNRCIGLAVLAALATTRIASADPAPSDEPKDRDVALGLALGGTAGSLVMFGAGLGAKNDALIAGGLVGALFAPSLGNWYAGTALTGGLGLRALSGLVIPFGLWATGCSNDMPCGSGQVGRGKVVIGVGVGLYAAGALWDFATARTRVDDFNHAHHLQVVPALAAPPPGSSAAAGYGVSLATHF